MNTHLTAQWLAVALVVLDSASAPASGLRSQPLQPHDETSMACLRIRAANAAGSGSLSMAVASRRRSDAGASVQTA